MPRSLQSFHARPLRAAGAAVLFAAFALLAACGESPTDPGTGIASGAGSALASAALPAVASTAATAATGATTIAGCDDVAVTVSADERRLIELHDATRASLGLPALCVDTTLTTAARAHSREMLTEGFFSHDSFDGTSFGVRIRGFGFPSTRGLAENVAWGTGQMGTPEDVFERFMASPSHHHNIVDGDLRRIGVGVAAGTFTGRPGARMYTVDFGTH